MGGQRKEIFPLSYDSRWLLVVSGLLLVSFASPCPTFFAIRQASKKTAAKLKLQVQVIFGSCQGRMRSGMLSKDCYITGPEANRVGHI